MRDSTCIEFLTQRGAKILVPFLPVFKVVLSGEEVALASVTTGVSKYEVVPEVDGIACPWHKMIDLPGFSQSAIAIEAVI